VVIPNNGTWKVSGAAFRLLAREATERLDSDDDREVLTKGQALNGLFLDQLDPEQAHRVALAMQGAAATLRTGLVGSTSEWDQSFADALDYLGLRLTELARSGDS
jgi:hypothetical protein